MSAALPPDVAAQLDGHRDITLFCRDADGHPIGYPMMISSRDGADIVFSTYRKSAKVRHIERDPRVALLSFTAAPAPDGGELVRWISMTGTAAVWQPTEAELDRVFPPAPRTADGRVPDTVGPLVRQRTLEGKRILLRVRLDEPDAVRIEEGRR